MREEGGEKKWEFLKRQEQEGVDLSNVLQLRNVCLYVLSYAGFFRSEEVLNIRVSHIRFYEGFMPIKLDKSKTDQLRQGDKVVIA